MAFSSDGTTLATCTEENIIKVYQKVQDWTSQTEFPTGKSHASTLALSGDGRILALLDTDEAQTGYQIRTYKYGSGDWDLFGTIDGNSNFRSTAWVSLSISNDGRTIAVALPFIDATRAGQVQLYSFDGSSWKQKGSYLNGDAYEYSYFFGYDISLSYDGSRVAVGDPMNSTNGERAGQVKVYQFENDTWMMLGGAIKGESGSHFGSSISLSSAGSSLAIGSLHGTNPSGNNKAGFVQVYSYDKKWNEKGNFLYGKKTDENFGGKVSLSSDGNNLAVSSLELSGKESGKVGSFQYVSDINSWIQTSDVVPLDKVQAINNFGYVLSLSSDGKSLAISSGTKGSTSGEVYLYAYVAGLGSWYLVGPKVHAFNKDGGFVVTLQWAAGASANKTDLSLFYQNCSTSANSDDVLELVSSSLVDGVFNATIHVDRSGLLDSTMTTMEEGVGNSAGTISFCTKAELLTYENMSVTSYLENINLSFDLTDASITLASDVMEKNLENIERNIDDEYAVEACVCRSETENECIGKEELSLLEQNGIVFVCISTNSEDILISNFDMKFEQSGKKVLTAVYSGFIGPENGELSTIVGDGSRYTVASRLVSKLFQNSSKNFNITGNAYLEYVRNERKERRLVPIQSPLNRHLGESAGKTTYKVEISFNSLSFFGMNKQNTIILFSIIAVCILAAVASILLIKLMKKNPNMHDNQTIETDMLRNETGSLSYERVTVDVSNSYDTQVS
eukprot:CAMPEP_0113302584 /NCGR_PEP_ID=MMETSP0010_2-20120614/3350_1 /TAXON_ID=216773 ORGANISM="Corethron hystrix, Strain 308" /NCGR_SAMPLE_ID=MMETSP0010_2 /ASSEMBLY_ACC=CAM_ASM_000155 /LENGTH=732 /DNA_ID=CAMNT_0000156427 /DNA_START=541 /DNA_END=2739 /DNA_ORIENTATION=- /assembly_acc=CAM_ASM_000155